MTINHVPKASEVNETGCCPMFEPKGWDGQTFTFKDKPFVRFTVRSFFHIPLNMDKQITSVMKTVENAGATSKDEPLMLSYDPSPWISEHYLAVTKEVADLENVKLSGTYLAKVYSGEFREAPNWMIDMQKFVDSKGKEAKKIYFNYTMCPSCAKHYGTNYVVAFAKI